MRPFLQQITPFPPQFTHKSDFRHCLENRLSFSFCRNSWFASVKTSTSNDWHELKSWETICEGSNWGRQKMRQDEKKWKRKLEAFGMNWNLGTSWKSLLKPGRTVKPGYIFRPYFNSNDPNKYLYRKVLGELFGNKEYCCAVQTAEELRPWTHTSKTNRPLNAAKMLPFISVKMNLYRASSYLSLEVNPFVWCPPRSQSQKRLLFSTNDVF